MPTQTSNGSFVRRDVQFDTDDGTTAAPEYSFDGYKVELSQKVALTPITPRHHDHEHGKQREHDDR